jgi:hypothetical protein
MQRKQMVLIVLGLVVGAVAARFYSARRWAAPARETMERPPAAIRRAEPVIVRQLSDASISMCHARYCQYA